VRVSFLEEKKAAPVAEAPRGALLPTSAVRAEGSRDVVYIVQDNTARERTVTLGGTMGDSRQVLSGVSVGDTVITDPAPTLKDGSAVTVSP
jgi:hypothetical protein